MSSTLRQITFLDDPYHDAFGNLRTASGGNRLDVEFKYNKADDYFDEVTNNGTCTYNGNSRDITLSISDAVNGTYAEMRSHPVPYTPGSSQKIDMTGVLDLANLGTGTAEAFLRTTVSGSTTTTTVAQSSWLNGNTSGIDWADSHILQMDFQSLKVGRIRFVMVRNGLPSDLCEINNDNTRNTGYWQLADGSCYWKVYNEGGATYCEMGYGSPYNAIGIRYKIATATASATMKAICCTVKSEGGDGLREIAGLPYSIDMAQTAKTVATTLIPLISIRPKSTFQTYDNLLLAIPKSITIQTDNPIRLVVLHDCTLTGASWADVDATNSMMEYDVTATALATTGHQVSTEYFATAKNTTGQGQGLLGKTVMWYRRNSVSGILTLAAIRTTATSASVLAGINWEELR